jgi:hypothetical protein
MIDSSDEFQNAENSIRVNLTPRNEDEPLVSHWIQPRRRSPSTKGTSLSQFKSYAFDLSEMDRPHSSGRVTHSWYPNQRTFCPDVTDVDVCPDILAARGWLLLLTFSNHFDRHLFEKTVAFAPLKR